MDVHDVTTNAVYIIYSFAGQDQKVYEKRVYYSAAAYQKALDQGYMVLPADLVQPPHFYGKVAVRYGPDGIEIIARNGVALQLDLTP